MKKKSLKEDFKMMSMSRIDADTRQWQSKEGGCIDLFHMIFTY